MNQYKFIHILWSGGALFNKRIIEIFNDEENDFDIDDHLFVTPYKHIYDEICSFANVVFEQEINPRSAELVNKYSEFGDWVFLHGMCSTTEALKIKYKNRRKIIWRTWGHDIGGYPYKKRDILRNIVKCFLNFLWKNEVKSFKAIGVANSVDKIVLEDRFGKINTMTLNYPAKGNIELYNSAIKKEKKVRKTVNVLVGHSGIDTDNHFEVIDRLKKYCNEDVCFIFVLSYGDQEYIEKVKEYVKRNCNDKYRLILETMPYEKYVETLADVDVAILDGKNSYALANVSMLLFFKKKLFLNRNGTLAKAFKMENIPFCYTDEIDNMSIEEFSSKVDFPNTTPTSLMPVGYERAVERWKTMLASLDK